MYPYERYKLWLKAGALLNRRHPESTVIEVYSLFDAVQYLAATGALPSSTLDSDTHLFKVVFHALSAKVTEEEDNYEDADLLLPQ